MLGGPGGPARFGALSGCRDRPEGRQSSSSTPAAFNAKITLPIAALLASDASRAVLASEVTPASICARLGATDRLASPVTEIIDGGAVCARAGAASSAPAAM